MSASGSTWCGRPHRARGSAGAPTYASAEDWLGPPTVDPTRAVGYLVRRYLGGFGPSTAAEVADWAGMPVTEISAVLDRLPLPRFRAEDGQTLFDVPGSALPDPAAPAPVRFLPTWDAMLLVQARREQVIAEAHRPPGLTVASLAVRTGVVRKARRSAGVMSATCEV